MMFKDDPQVKVEHPIADRRVGAIPQFLGVPVIRDGTIHAEWGGRILVGWFANRFALW